MTTIYSDVTKAIGCTPMIQLHHIAEGASATIFAKLEFQNPLGSVKDRIGIAMIEAAEATAQEILSANLDKLKLLAEALLEKEIMDSAEVDEVINGGSGDKEPTETPSPASGK